MANFLVIVPARAASLAATKLFHRGVSIARGLKFPPAARLIEDDWVCAAKFPRHNGSGAHIEIDSKSGTWLLAMGTWFHQDGYGPGLEARLLQRYGEIGAQELGRELEGFFTLVIGDAATREIVVLTDIIGSSHCFLRPCEEGIALSGSSLLLAGLRDFGLDPIGCQEFLHTGVIYEDRSLYREVHKLPPATILRISCDGVKPDQPYWQTAELAHESLDGETAALALWENLTKAAAKVGRIFHRPVCDLTGGYDSRAMVAGMLGAGVRFSTTVSGPSDSPDVIISRNLATSLGLPHSHSVAGEPPSLKQIRSAIALTDGEYDLIEYARIQRIHQQLSEHFDISINGSFGEVARGYWWELLFPRIGARTALDAMTLARKRFAAFPYDPSLAPSEQQIDLTTHFAGVIERANRGLSGARNTLQMDNAYLLLRMQRWQGRIASSTNRLWPCLSPFLFRSVLEPALKTRPRARVNSILIRRMLARFQPRLATYPLEHGQPAAPVTWKNVHRFLPLLRHYQKRLWHKLTRRWRSSPSASSSIAATVRMRLWDDAELRGLLDPATARIGCFIEQTTLADYLARSRQAEFPFDGQWARLLTVELTLRELEFVGARPTTHTSDAG